MPKGELLCTRNGPYTKWYLSNFRAPTYLHKQNRKLAEALACKKFYQLQLKETQKELQMINQCIDYYSKKSTESIKLLDESSPYYELLSSYLKETPGFNTQWRQTPYPKNNKYSEGLIYKTLAGEFVRSKSEVIIANVLFLNQIPYRYECELLLDGIAFYPDFTIYLTDTGSIVYWEHFGMMDKESYSAQVWHKLKIYSDHQIIPTINLITTYETSDCPIDSDQIQRIIDSLRL